MNKKHDVYIKFLIAFCFISFLSILYFKICRDCINFKLLTPDMLKEWILAFGPLAIIVYIFLYAINTVTLLPPIGIMSLSAGFIFGPYLGTIGIMMGSFIGTTMTFFISRIVGRKFVEGMIRGKARDFEEKLNERGFATILFIRLVPIVPWEIVNYAAGLSKISYRDYVLATLIGILPAVMIQTFFADRLAHFDIRDPKLIGAVAGFLLLVFIPALYLALKKRLKKS